MTKGEQKADAGWPPSWEGTIDDRFTAIQAGRAYVKIKREMPHMAFTMSDAKTLVWRAMKNCAHIEQNKRNSDELPIKDPDRYIMVTITHDVNALLKKEMSPIDHMTQAIPEHDTMDISYEDGTNYGSEARRQSNGTYSAPNLHPSKIGASKSGTTRKVVIDSETREMFDALIAFLKGKLSGRCLETLSLWTWQKWAQNEEKESKAEFPDYKTPWKRCDPPISRGAFDKLKFDCMKRLRKLIHTDPKVSDCLIRLVKQAYYDRNGNVDVEVDSGFISMFNVESA